MTYSIIGEHANHYTRDGQYLYLGLTRAGIEPMTYSIRGKHANHYTTEMGNIYT
jgi:hypothetical protein